MRITHKETYPNFQVGDRVRATAPGYAFNFTGTVVEAGHPFVVQWDTMSFPVLYPPESVEHIDEFAVWAREVRTNAGL